ncbi:MULTISPECIES: hypothetical protein [Virgibacillus]|uniref:DUF1433 domain-containing protein n=2 Tax=Virgibacillus TaxID=84406 RepID=A0A024QGQ1_9BACI|nr:MULTISPECIES: hypothetical protein [Virgibacillus]MYL43138.1 hypothetical protein [Virgibacillus massiliensis]GGJ64744.1 hypothetical protein GCM10007111_28310 [Virgibacillus kapii]CDQ41733.1 hypothetical protein BN990_04110 [Virgibacillus massiliensis]
MNQNNDKYDKETISKANEVTKSFIENNYKGVQSIELEEPYQSPMGAMTVDGKVNSKGGFSITINEDFTVAGISIEEGFPDEKDECKEKFCDY